MTTPLHEQLRNAADDCTPSPLKDLLNLAADAVDEYENIINSKFGIQADLLRRWKKQQARIEQLEGELANRAVDAVDARQEPVAWMWHDGSKAASTQESIDLPNWDDYYTIPLYTHPAPIPDGMMLVPPERYGSTSDAVYQRFYDNGWNDCREAMLKPAGESS